MYVDQLKEFIRFVEEGRVKHQYDALSSVESLRVVDAFFKSNKTGKKVDIEQNKRFSF
jgi:predicted dehydrogenase